MAEEEKLEVDCDCHGKGYAAVVCSHLLNEKEKALGFIENSSVPGDYQGWCYACEELFLQEQDRTKKFREFTQMSIVCEECYAEIKARHTKNS